MKVKSLSRVRLFVIPWTVADQAPPSMGFSRQECWSGLPFPSPGDLPDPGIEPGSPALQADALPSEPPGKPNYARNGSLNIKEVLICLSLPHTMFPLLLTSDINMVHLLQLMNQRVCVSH